MLGCMSKNLDATVAAFDAQTEVVFQSIAERTAEQKFTTLEGLCWDFEDMSSTELRNVIQVLLRAGRIQNRASGLQLLYTAK